MIDGGSCTKVVSKDAATKKKRGGGLKMEPHPKLYKVAWVNSSNLKVHLRCLLTYSIGRILEHDGIYVFQSLFQVGISLGILLVFMVCLGLAIGFVYKIWRS